MGGTATSSKARPRGLTRLLLRAPIGLYRLHLGWMLGQRFLYLEHVGRKSGLPRSTVIEVVDHDPATGSYFVCSGWGRTSDWYRNVTRTPEVHVTVGTRRFAARARELGPEEARARLAAYGARNPRALAKLAAMMLGEKSSDLDAAIDGLVEVTPLIELAPREG